MGWVIAVGNQKGGVGKTTAAIDLVALRGHVPLLRDLDSQGSSAPTSVGLRPGGGDDEA